MPKRTRAAARRCGRASSASAGASRACRASARPYFIFSLGIALAVSLAATGLALFALGIARGRVARTALVRSGLQVLAVGGVSAGAGYLIGVVVPHLFGA